MPGKKPVPLPSSSRSRVPPKRLEKEWRLYEKLIEAPPQDNLFLGRAGEMLVAAYLLRLGFNTSPLPVDTGVDLLVHRESHLPVPQAEHEVFQVQVKTTATGEYRARLPVKKVHELWYKAINLAVVFWSLGDPQIVLIPPSLLRMLTSGGFADPRAPLVMTGDMADLRVISHDRRYFIRNRDNEITAMLNRFDRLEPLNVDTSELPSYATWSEGPGLVEFDLH